ncbi:MAG: membrane protein insertase YidC [bacterium]
MDSHRPFLYLTLIFLLFMLWTSWQQHNAPPPPASKSTTSNTTTDTKTTATAGDVANEAVPTTARPTNSDSLQATQQAAANAKNIRVKTDVLDILISTQGASLVQADLLAYPVSLEEPDTPVRILNLAEKGYAAQSGLIHNVVTDPNVDKNTLAPNHNALFQSAQDEYMLTGDTLQVPLTWTNAQGVTVTKIYTFKRGEYLIDMETKITNQSQQAWSGYEYRRLRHAPVNTNQAAAMFGMQSYIGAAYYDTKYNKYTFGDIEDEPLEQQINGGWLAMLQHYFISAWIPNANEASMYFSKAYQNNGVVSSYTIGQSTTTKQIASGTSDSFTSQLYVGPKLQDRLEEISPGLDLTVDYGFLTIFAKPLFWLLQFFHNILGNWGWAIIFVTIAIKLVFFYPSAISYKSMAKMKKLAPMMKSINERHANDPQAKQKAMMDLYKKEKINPLGGCLPILIQMPVFMGLYWVLLEAVELRQAPWLLWYQDLSIMDPYLILPILMGVTMWAQQKLNPPPSDPMQQKIFQYLPFIFTFMFLWFPAGLVLYWFSNNLLSIAQQWFINKKIIGEA